MTGSRRWWLAAVVVALLAGAPVVARALPARAPDLTVAELVGLMRAAQDQNHPYSGQVELAGNLDLPVTSRFTDVGALLGERTSLRVWWRGSEDWRVDKLLVAGETDLVKNGPLTTEWSYESNRVVQSIDPEVRLPRTADLLPPALAERVLGEAEQQSAVRIAARRVAGIGAPGVRVRPADPRSSIDHLDLWADPGSGVVLRLDAYAAGESTPSFSTAFTEFSALTPDRSRTRFVPPAGVRFSFEEVLDIADSANQYAPFAPPDEVAGLKRAATPRGAVGVYGTGLTRLLVIPLRDRDAHTLGDQLERSAGVVESDVGLQLQAGPLGVLVAEHGDVAWLVAGPVTPGTLVTAARDLLAGAGFR
jgi:hypothetical protein